MSQNTSIREGDQGRAFGPVRALLVQGDGGQYYLWVPESERQLGTKSIDKNGIYQAASDGVYGWSSVTVNVPTDSSVVGRDPDTGEEVIVKPDPETGDITKTVLPVEIRVVTPPDNPYGVYVDGQTIGKTGMVVKAYTATGAEWGVVPNGEITLHPNRADFSQVSGTRITQYGEFEQGPWPQPINSVIGRIELDYTNSKGEVFPGYIVYESDQYVAVRMYGENSNQILFCASEPGKKCKTGYQIGTTNPMWREYSINRTYTYNGKTVYYIDHSDGYGWHPGAPGHNLTVEGADLNVAKAAWVIVYGEMIKSGQEQTITVSWPRTGDGAVLEATFEIMVGPHGGTGED